jgi:hypothetical protein
VERLTCLEPGQEVLDPVPVALVGAGVFGVLGVELGERLLDVRGPATAVGEPGRQVVIVAPGVLGGVDPGGLGHDLVGDPLCLVPHRRTGAVRAPRGVRGDLGAIDRHDPDLDHPGGGAQPQHLGEHVRERVLVTGAEPGDRGVVRGVLATHHPERDMVQTQPLDPPRGTLPDGVGVQQQRQQHVRVEPLAAHPAGPHLGVEPGRVELVDHVQHEPHQMVLGQPVRHVRRQQELLIPDHRAIRPRHPPIISRPPTQTDHLRRRFRNSHQVT